MGSRDQRTSFANNTDDNQFMTMASPQQNSAGRYQVLRELGAGATSRVSLAFDRVSGGLVALKQLFEANLIQGNVRMQREFRALKRLTHPNIVKVFDHGQHNGTPFLVMEFIEGQSLSTWLDAQPAFQAMTRVFAQLADALSSVHAEGLIHRDLKPENILIGQDGQPKLMDFGLAKQLEASVGVTRAGAVVGTVLYMAPEQCRGGELDYRADLYALGALMYRAFTGQPPFPGESLAQVILAHLQQPPRAPRQINPDLPEGIESLLLGLLSKHPLDRPQTARAVRDALMAELEGESSPSSSLSGAARADALLVAPLLGRDTELLRLLPVLNFEQPGEVIAITGDAGLGKTRLLQTLEERAQVARLRFAWGEAIENDATPFGAISRLITSLVRHHKAVLDGLPDELRQELTRINPALGSALPPDSSLPAEIARLRLYEAVTTLLERASKRAVLILENLHWADVSTLELLSHVMRAVPELRLIVTYRVEDLPEGRQTPLGLAQPSLTLNLEGLPDETMRALLAARLDGVIEEGLALELVSRAGGNPWVLEEQLKVMLESVSITRRAGMYEWNHQSASLPSSLGDLLEQRLAALPQTALEFARAASVLGRQFLFEDVRELLEWDFEAALDALEQLVRARVMIETPNTRGEGYRFTHPLYAETIRQGLLPLRRRMLHARAAERLDSRVTPMELAQHHLEANNDVRALEFALTAGRQAQSTFAYPLAERAYRLALQASHATGSNLRALLCQHYLAQVLSATGRNSEAVQLWTEVIRQASQMPGGETLCANAKISLVTVQRRQGSVAQSLSLLGEPRRGDPLYDELCTELCAVYRTMGDHATARRYGLEGLAEARRLGRTGAVARALVQLAEVENAQNRLSRGERLLRLATECADTTENHHLRSFAWNNLGSNLYTQSRDDEALLAWETAARSSRVIGDIAYQTTIEINIALILLGQNAFEDGLARFDDAARLCQRAGYARIEKIALYNAAICEYALGRLEQARARFGRVTDHYLEAASRVWMARITLALGDDVVLALPEVPGDQAMMIYWLTEAEWKLSLSDHVGVSRLLNDLDPASINEPWFWALVRVHAAWRLGDDLEAELNELDQAATQSEQMIQQALAQEYTMFVRLVVKGDWTAAERTHLGVLVDRYRSSQIGVFARDAAMALAGL
jgi:tetratricopeptide (TPR) repeat protein